MNLTKEYTRVILSFSNNSTPEEKNKERQDLMKQSLEKLQKDPPNTKDELILHNLKAGAVHYSFSCGHQQNCRCGRTVRIHVNYPLL
jgi:hypothetical protein